MRIVIAADHAGYHLKEEMVRILFSEGFLFADMVTGSADPVDCPDFARSVGEALPRGQADRGILICGSGVGVSVAASKIPSIRVGLCHDAYSAHQDVEHDDMNVLVLGSRVIGPELAAELIRTFLKSRFTGEERHRRRLGKLKEMEEHYCGTNSGDRRK